MLFRKTAVLLILVLYSYGNNSIAKISEKSLENYKSIFLSRMIEENPNHEELIRKYFDGIVTDGRVGVRLLDKFGIFMQNMEQKSLILNKTRFYSGNGSFCLFLILSDKKDDQAYTMFIEYEYGRNAQCVLKNIFFSIVFDERMKELKNFFEAR